MRRRVLIADDHRIVRQGLRALLEGAGHAVVAEASNGREAIGQIASQPVDIAVLDVAMPVLNGVDAARELSRANPNLRSILLTMHAERPYLIEGLRAGARGYVLKTQAAEDLVQAIEEVARGAIYVSPGVAVGLVDAALGREPLHIEQLTARECQILQLIAESRTTKQIARQLDISYKTAESHRTRLMRKLDIHDTAGLVRYAIRHGLLHL